MWMSQTSTGFWKLDVVFTSEGQEWCVQRLLRKFWKGICLNWWDRILTEFEILAPVWQRMCLHMEWDSDRMVKYNGLLWWTIDRVGSIFDWGPNVSRSEIEAREKDEEHDPLNRLLSLPLASRDCCLMVGCHRFPWWKQWEVAVNCVVLASGFC